MSTISYAASEAGLIAMPKRKAVALAQISIRKLMYWDITHLVRASIRRGSMRLYTFDDLVALLVTAELRRRGQSLQNVRKIVGHLRGTYGYDTPLSKLHFATAGREVYVRHPDGSWEGDLSPAQLVIVQVIDLDLIRSMILGSLVRPPEFAGHIESRRGVKGGKPVFRGTRIPVATVNGWLESGHPDNAVLEAYPDLTAADLAAAREFATS